MLMLLRLTPCTHTRFFTLSPNLERRLPIAYVEAQQGHLPRFKLEIVDESLAKRDGLTLAILALAVVVDGLDGAGKPLIPKL